MFVPCIAGGPGSSVGIATGYGLDGPWGRDFSHTSRPALGPTSLLYNGYRVCPGGKAARAWCWPPPPPKRRGREWVGLYLYSPCGPFVACYRVTFTFYRALLIGYNIPTLCTDYLSFIYYSGSYMFRHLCAIFRERPLSFWVTWKSEMGCL
jgi:hypothetical protein